MSREWVTFERDCEGIEIPSGRPITMTKGSQALLTQALGGSYTVMTDRGQMARIAGQDADAIGKLPTEAAAETDEALGQDEVEARVWSQLRTCYDPEIPVNIVDLGLVYSCDVTGLDGGGYRASVVMTLTAPGCGMGEFLKRDVEDKLAAIPGIEQVMVELTFEPTWDREMMSEAARLQLGMM